MDSYNALDVVLAILLFLAAGLCEIGGGWLVWKWRRDGWHWGFGIAGGAVLVVYGLIPTLQKQEFGRTYAVYGGFFIVLAIMWGWLVDRNKPDRWDLLGAGIAIAGACVIYFVPRKLVPVTVVQ